MMNENTFEINRKMFHVILGVIFVFSIYYGVLAFWMALALLIISICFSLLSIKYSLPIINLFKIRSPRAFKNSGKRRHLDIFSIICTIASYGIKYLVKEYCSSIINDMDIRGFTFCSCRKIIW